MATILDRYSLTSSEEYGVEYITLKMHRSCTLIALSDLHVDYCLIFEKGMNIAQQEQLTPLNGAMFWHIDRICTDEFGFFCMKFYHGSIVAATDSNR